MSKNKVITGVGVICIITGIVGGTWSGIKAIPKFIDNLQEAQKVLQLEKQKYLHVSRTISISSSFVKRLSSISISGLRSQKSEK